MNIYKKNDKVIIELDYLQEENNYYNDMAGVKNGMTDNLVGVIAGEEMTISQLNDLSYKGDQQEGPPLVHYYGNKDDFIKICGELGIEIIEHWVCCDCGKPIYGAATFKENGFQCFDCNYKQEEQ
jgi:DNA-directed RNA polymerase subunit RPC12/RpoP